jgi:hypothetical protein
MSDADMRNAVMRNAERFTIESARRAAGRDELGAWVVRFLASPGSDNAPLAEQLSDPPRVWIGPLLLRIDQLHRLAGPPGHPVLRPVDDDFWRDDVDDLAEKVAEGWEPPPMIVTFRDDQLVLEDGNHRTEGLRRTGEDEAWCVVSFASPEERDRFLERAGRVADRTQ